jgi:F-type H+-transporting ATPase subunit epsilon
MNLKLVTLLGVQIDEEVYEVIIPTSMGEIAVFPSHEPLVTVVVPGAIAIRRHKGDGDEDLSYFAVSDGVVEISQTSVRILVDEADHGEDIVESEAKEALNRAIELRDNATDQIELDQAYQLVDRHAVRLKVAELRRRRRG